MLCRYVSFIYFNLVLFLMVLRLFPSLILYVLFQREGRRYPKSVYKWLMKAVRMIRRKSRFPKEAPVEVLDVLLCHRSSSQRNFLLCVLGV